MSEQPRPDDSPQKWYRGVTRYQWLVLVIASLGWIFDIFEGQIFVASMNEAMPSLMERGEAETDAEFSGRKRFYDNIALGAFLLGGALGGILFGMISDRIGRKRAMSYTILFYSLFTCVSAFSMEWWHLAALRFLVALGVGGEWAVASALVYEVFPKHARAHVGGIFHASSVFGTYLAVAAGVFLIANDDLQPYLQKAAQAVGIHDPAIIDSLKWRLGFALGVLPAVLIIWIRMSLREPESWQAARQRADADASQRVGRLGELFSSGLRRNTFVGFTLAAVGLATFWGVHIYGKNLLRNAKQADVLQQAAREGDAVLSSEQTARVLKANESRLKHWEMLGMLIVTTGGGLGLVSFGPLSQRLGRRAAFLVFHLGGLAAALLLFNVPLGVQALYGWLLVFGFLTLGMHAGYAIYFPELFPTRLRGTGAGFCFNGGRMAAAPILFLSGWLQKGATLTFAGRSLTLPKLELNEACTWLSLLYLLGAAILLIAPETRGRTMEDDA